MSKPWFDTPVEGLLLLLGLKNIPQLSSPHPSKYG